MTSILPLNCPTCGKALPEGRKTPTFPFCSVRCKMADLGRWFSGEYRVSEKLPREDMDLDEGLDYYSDAESEPE